jgi:hypothetical protein
MANSSDLNNLDHADVRIPPPLIYVAGSVLGLLLERAFSSFGACENPQPRSGCSVYCAMGNLDRVEHRFISSGAHQFSSHQADDDACRLRPISIYAQPDVSWLGLLVLRASALVWHVLGVDSVACRNRTRSTLRHRPRRAVPGAKIWRRVSQVQGGRATVDLTGVSRLRITLRWSTQRAADMVGVRFSDGLFNH